MHILPPGMKCRDAVRMRVACETDRPTNAVTRTLLSPAIAGGRCRGKPEPAPLPHSGYKKGPGEPDPFHSVILV
ncbi:hypothetical protein EM6_1030 [Asticcacaulis excentricus]|uniref:Uncharacterized protein n=1 Tax=Asticcacaulis excentricus TaxID=78587 RepID=A0A3G9G1C3_9CAUL|nr:hypothetical protein EM6_1030 [Asticcacaulis excentricus]